MREQGGGREGGREVRGRGGGREEGKGTRRREGGGEGSYQIWGRHLRDGDRRLSRDWVGNDERYFLERGK